MPPKTLAGTEIAVIGILARLVQCHNHRMPNGQVRCGPPGGCGSGASQGQEAARQPRRAGGAWPAVASNTGYPAGRRSDIPGRTRNFGSA